MSLLWFLGGLIGGALAYHQFVPWMMKKMGRDQGVLRQMVRSLNHDAFLNLRLAVEEERKRRDSETR